MLWKLQASLNSVHSDYRRKTGRMAFELALTDTTPSRADHGAMGSLGFGTLMTDFDAYMKLDPDGLWEFSREVHRLGFEAVEAIIARYGQRTDLGLGIRMPGEEASSSAATLEEHAIDRDVLADAQDAIEAWFALMNSSLAAARHQLATTMTEWGGGPSSSGEVELPDSHPGRPSSGTFWVRLATPGLAGRYTVSTSGLVGPGGFLIPPEMIGFTPDAFSLISGIKQKVDIEVAVPAGAPGGRYRGFITVPEGVVASDGSSTSDIVLSASLRIVAM